MRQMVVSAVAVLVALALWAGAAPAQGVPGIDVNKCLAGKTKCVNKKTAGLLKCREKCQRNPDKCGSAQTVCEDKVRAKFDGGTKGVEQSCFGKLEAKSGSGRPESDCTTVGDLDEMEARVDALVADLVATLEGHPPPTCGDDVVTGVESCDGLDLGGATCASLGFATGTLACTAGCGYDVSGCTPYPPPPTPTLPPTLTPTPTATPTPTPTATPTQTVAQTPTPTPTATPTQSGTQTPTPVCTPHSSGTYTDNCDGTVTDSATGLQWEQKTDDGSIHDKDNGYTWTSWYYGTDPDGTAFTVFLATLNTPPCFAGHCDWRLPDESACNSCRDPFFYFCTSCGVHELETILVEPWPCSTHPCIDPIFGPTAWEAYWSSTTEAYMEENAWGVDFYDGIVFDYEKSSVWIHARAVRGGS